MKSIADIKRKMVLNSKWHTLWQCNGCQETDMGIRRVGIIQSNCFGFESLRSPGQFSYCDWPKRSEVVFISDTCFQILHGAIVLTYTFIE